MIENAILLANGKESKFHDNPGGDMMNHKKVNKPEVQQSQPVDLDKGKVLSVPPDLQADQTDTKVYDAIRTALKEARTQVVVTVNSAMVGAYWEIGR